MTPSQELRFRLEAAQRAKDQRLVDAKAAREAQYRAEQASDQPLRASRVEGSAITAGVVASNVTHRSAMTR